MIHKHPHHEKAEIVVNKLLDDGDVLVLSPQVIGESYAISTSQKRVEKPLSLEQFQSMILSFLSDPAVEFVSPGIHAMKLALETGVKTNAISYQIFDLILYGTMLEHEIRTIATINIKHFRNLEGIELVPIP